MPKDVVRIMIDFLNMTDLKRLSGTCRWFFIECKGCPLHIEYEGMSCTGRIQSGECPIMLLSHRTRDADMFIWHTDNLLCKPMESLLDDIWALEYDPEVVAYAYVGNVERVERLLEGSLDYDALCALGVAICMGHVNVVDAVVNKKLAQRESIEQAVIWIGHRRWCPERVLDYLLAEGLVKPNTVAAWTVKHRRWEYLTGLSARFSIAT